MNHTRNLAAFCANLSYDQLPKEVIGKAKLCILDYIANIYGSLELDAVRRVIDHVRSINVGGPSTVLGCGFKTDIDFVESSVFDMLLLQKFQEYKDISAVERDLKKN